MSNFNNKFFNRNKGSSVDAYMKETLNSIPDSHPDSPLVITFEQAKNETNYKRIFYSVGTVWWTSDAKDLKQGVVPLDAFGSPLMENDNVEGWFNYKAISEHPAYGKPERRIRNFMLAHAKNIHIACNLMTKKERNSIMNFVDFCKFCDAKNI